MELDAKFNRREAKFNRRDAEFNTTGYVIKNATAVRAEKNFCSAVYFVCKLCRKNHMASVTNVSLNSNNTFVVSAYDSLELDDCLGINTF